MSKIIRIQYIIIGLLLLVICAGLIYFYCYKKSEHIKSEHIKFLPVKAEEIRTFANKSVDILIVGNSISIHGICDYWWGNWGMAASSKNEDYVHKLATMISRKYNVKFSVINFAIWEINAHDRDEFLELLNLELSKNPNYLILQLGENITDTKTLERDFESFIKHITNISPKTKIIIIGNFWENYVVDDIKNKVCQKYKITFVSLKNIQNEKFSNKLGNTVYDESGNIHIIEHSGVAKHPNDEGMENIAKLIYNNL